MEVEKLPLDLQAVGHFAKTKGVEGEIRIRVEEEYENLMVEGRFLFVKIQGNPVPIQILSLQSKGNGILCLLEGYDNIDKAKNLSGEDFYMNFTELSDKQINVIPLTNLVDYIIEDETSGEVGKIKAIEKNKIQILAEVKTEGGNVLIPLVEEFIQSINNRERTITFALPEGIFDHKY